MTDDLESGARRTERFRAFLDANRHLSIKDVAQLARRSVKTVYMWRSGVPKAIPVHVLENLELKASAESGRS